MVAAVAEGVEEGEAVAMTRRPSTYSRSYAIAGALVDDSVHGRVPGEQVVPILEHLEANGWKLVRRRWWDRRVANQLLRKAQITEPCR